MKKVNLWHIVWIAGIYIILLAILFLVIKYKVKWEDKDLNTYLYFYNCSNNLCTTNNRVTDYYSKVKCEKDICPHIIERNNNYVILSTDNKDFVFDYMKGNTINDSYIAYSFVNNFLRAKNSDNKYGIIDLEGNILVDFNYNKIIDYKDNYLAYSENGKVGIINDERNIDIKPTYDDVQLLSDSIYAYREDNKYYVASYDTELPVNNEGYDYIYGIKNIIITVKDRKLDITDVNLNSKLLLKIDTVYSYTTEKERGSLNIYTVNNLLYFNIVNGDAITYYVYDLKNNKLFS